MSYLHTIITAALDAKMGIRQRTKFYLAIIPEWIKQYGFIETQCYGIDDAFDAAYQQIKEGK